MGKVTCESHIADDLIIYCPNISEFPSFLYIFLPHTFLSQIFQPVSETTLVSLSLSLCVTENFKRSNKTKKKKKKKITTSTCPNAYHCRGQHFV